MNLKSEMKLPSRGCSGESVIPTPESETLMTTSSRAEFLVSSSQWLLIKTPRETPRLRARTERIAMPMTKTILSLIFHWFTSLALSENLSFTSFRLWFRCPTRFDASLNLAVLELSQQRLNLSLAYFSPKSDLHGLQLCVCTSAD